MGTDFQFEELCFYVDSSFLRTIVDKLVILLSRIFPIIKDSLHYIALFGSS